MYIYICACNKNNGKKGHEGMKGEKVKGKFNIFFYLFTLHPALCPPPSHPPQKKIVLYLQVIETVRSISKTHAWLLYLLVISVWSLFLLDIVESISVSRVFKILSFFSALCLVSFSTLDAVCHNLITLWKSCHWSSNANHCLICILTVYCYIPGFHL